MGGAPLDSHDKSTIHVGKYISPMHPLGRNLRVPTPRNAPFTFRK